MTLTYRIKLIETANAIDAMGGHVWFTNTEKECFRVANRAESWRFDGLNVYSITSTHITIAEVDGDTHYEIPLWQFSEEFLYQLWCTYKKEIKASLTIQARKRLAQVTGYDELKPDE